MYELVYNVSAEESGNSKQILWLFHERSKRDANKQLLPELQKEDLTAEELQKQEQAAFPLSKTAKSDAVAVARKLTMISEMNPCFFADNILWQWVEKARRHNDTI